MTLTQGVRIPAQRAAEMEAAAEAFLAMGEVFAGAAKGGWARVRDGVGVMVTGAPVPTLNGVLCARVGAVAAAAALLDEVAATGLPHCFETRAGDAPGEALARSRGMTEDERVPFMLLHEVPVARDVEGVRRLIPGEFATHLDTMTAGFEGPPEMVAVFRGSTMLERENVRAYVVEDGGVPVATSMSIVAEGHVGVFNVATLPSHRGRGYGAALTARAVADGFAAGAATAFLQSSEMGRSVYERLGFRTAEEWTVWIA
jgi:ribosomal protein S18 acetylase RimI-like enzyme